MSRRWCCSRVVTRTKRSREGDVVGEIETEEWTGSGARGEKNSFLKTAQRVDEGRKPAGSVQSSRGSSPYIHLRRRVSINNHGF